MKLLHLSGGTENPSKASISTVSVPPEVRNWHLSNTSQKCYHYNIYFLTYLLTPWCRVLLEKPTSMQLVKKFPAFHGTWRFITALISICHLSLSWASLIHSIYPHPTSWRSILILSIHLRLCLPSGLLPFGFPSKTLYTPLLTHTSHMPNPSHSSRFYHPYNIGWRVQITKKAIKGNTINIYS